MHSILSHTLLSLLVLSISNTYCCHARVSTSSYKSKTQSTIIQQDIPASSKAGHELIQASRSLKNQDNRYDSSFLQNYAIKFINCHSVTEWHNDLSYGNNDDDDVDDDYYLDQDWSAPIITRQLVRFRLCPKDSCRDYSSKGCSSKFGDYIIDMETFLYYFLTAQEDLKDNLCLNCQEECFGDDYDDDGIEQCLNNCYSTYGVEGLCDNGDDDGNQRLLGNNQYYNKYYNKYYNNNADDAAQDDDDADDAAAAAQDDDTAAADDDATDDGETYYKDAVSIDPRDYVQCSAFDAFVTDDGSSSYIGPYCSNSGKAILLGHFNDGSCSSFSSCGPSCFYNHTGSELPNTKQSLVTTTCVSCDNTYSGGAIGECKSIYKEAGKCESRMFIDYPNEAACTYIKGVQYLDSNGVIFVPNPKRSAVAGVAVGFLSSIAILSGLYANFLKSSEYDWYWNEVS